MTDCDDAVSMSQLIEYIVVVIEVEYCCDAFIKLTKKEKGERK